MSVKKGPMPTIIRGSDTLMLYAAGHLSAALRFSRRLAVEENGGKDHQVLRDYATASVFAAVAALESYANELFFQPQTTFPEHSPKLLAEIWELSERKPIIDKFNLALRLKNQPTFDEKQPPAKNVVL